MSIIPSLFIGTMLVHTHTHTHTHTHIYIFKIGRSTKRFVFFEFIYFVLTYELYICMFPACCFHQKTCVAQGFFNGVLNEIWTHSCFQYKWPLVGHTGLYRGHCSSFLECVYFGLLYPSLIFDMFIVMCVCVCVCVLELKLQAENIHVYNTYVRTKWITSKNTNLFVNLPILKYILILSLDLQQPSLYIYIYMYIFTHWSHNLVCFITFELFTYFQK